MSKFYDMIRCEGKDHLLVNKSSKLGKWLLDNPNWISRTSGFVRDYVASRNCVLLEKKKYYELPVDPVRTNRSTGGLPDEKDGEAIVEDAVDEDE